MLDGGREESPGVLRIAATVDWLTATHRGVGYSRALATYGMHLVSREARMGNPRSPWAFYGYVGTVSGRASVGERRDGAICVVRSDLAAEVWKHVHSFADHVSRIDLALTVWYARPMEGVTDEYEAAILGRSKQAGHPITVGRWHSAKGGETLYIGARSSERFCRIYNKHAQSGSADYQNAWRYEVEYKGDAAGAVADALAVTNDQPGCISDTVLDYLARYGLHLPIDTGSLAVRDRHQLDTTTDAKRLEWLRSSIRPTILGLVERQGYEKVLETLGIPPEMLYTEHLADPSKRRKQTWPISKCNG